MTAISQEGRNILLRVEMWIARSWGERKVAGAAAAELDGIVLAQRFVRDFKRAGRVPRWWWEIECHAAQMSKTEAR